MNSDRNNHHQNTENKRKQEWEIKIEQTLIEFRQASSRLTNEFFQKFSKKQIIQYTVGAVILAWLASSIYIVDEGNRGVVTRFGAYLDTTMPGPHWHLPYPIEQVNVVNIEQQRFIEIGYRSSRGRINASPVLAEAMMLTKDENIVNLRLAVQYQIKNARDYLFNVKANENTLKQVTESVQRGVIGGNSMDFILTEGRSQIVSEIKQEIQEVMNIYGTGLHITSVNLQDAQPPEEVQNAFEDAIRAREDKQRLINEAEAYANEVIPKSRGTAARLTQEAEAYEATIVAQAKGESERFDQLLAEYQKAPKVTRKRLYLEAKEKLYRKTNKVVVNVENGNNMFYLPLNPVAPQTNTNHAGTSHNSTQTSHSSTNDVANQAHTTKSTIRSSRSQK